MVLLYSGRRICAALALTRITAIAHLALLGLVKA
jgi:hypothetical protein